MIDKIKIAPYDSNYPHLFEGEAVRLKLALGHELVDIHHIGSTSVPGLWSKPKLDILLIVKDLVKALPLVEEGGYIKRGEFNIPFHMVFSEGKNETRVNIHMYEEGNPEIELNLTFRDFLRSHPDYVEKYSNLKTEILKEEKSQGRTYLGLREYTLGKNKLIKEILDKAGFEGVCMRFCIHYDEWEAAKYFRQKYFFDKVSVEDPYTWTFEHKDHIHLVLYKGTKIIGYCHLQLWPENRAALRIIVIDEALRHQGLGSHFFRLCEKLLKIRGTTLLQIQSSQEALPFYRKHDYVDMPFNDPDGYESDPQDTEIGKAL